MPGGGNGRQAASADARPHEVRALLVDADGPARAELAAWLRGDGHAVAESATIAQARERLHDAPFDLIILDLDLPDGSGRELLRTLREERPDADVVALSSAATIPLAVDAMRSGATYFAGKPLASPELGRFVQQAAQRRALRAAPAQASAAPARPHLDHIIGQTWQMQRVFDLVEAVADSKATVLMHGETGTGKSLIARAIHQRSQRRQRPVVEVSCGAIPETLLASELFGHVRGAFTGALGDKVGKFAAADGGTIFLDEINCASPLLQMKLLRVLQEKQFEPLGSNRTITVDVRAVLATNVDLEAEVRAGRFREDLFYRINVVKIELPPLRDRLSDIPLLAEHFLAHFARQAHRPVCGLSAEALDCMQRYHWPGNVRELENCVERAVVLARGPRVAPEDLPPQILRAADGAATHYAPGRGQTLREALADPEKRIIAAALAANGWNRQSTARVLNINRTTLYKKMKRYGLAEPSAQSQPSMT